MTHDNFLLILVLKLVLYNGITIFVRFKFKRGEEIVLFNSLHCLGC